MQAEHVVAALQPQQLAELHAAVAQLSRSSTSTLHVHPVSPQSSVQAVLQGLQLVRLLEHESHRPLNYNYQ